MSILLIDDDEFENIVVTRLLAKHTKSKIKVDYAKTLDEGLAFLKNNQYEYVYLDDELSYCVNATKSVDIIRDYLSGAQLIIISNNVNREYLRDASILDVAAIVSKNDLSDYVNETAA